MYKNVRILWAICALFLFFSCNNKGTSDANDEVAEIDSTLMLSGGHEDQEVDEIEEVSKHVDEVFNDFLYTFIENHHLQKQRIDFPLVVVSAQGDTTELQSQDWYDDFGFLTHNDYFTVLYNTEDQIEEEKLDTVERYVSVEQISFRDGIIKSYDFERNDGRWMLAGITFMPFSESELGDFLHFYSSFCSDSIYRQEHLARYVDISITDPEDDSQRIDGNIEREQFPIFCPSVPDGVISNIRYGQPYDNKSSMLLMKSGQGNGLQEIFSFKKRADKWQMVKYEN